MGYNPTEEELEWDIAQFKNLFRKYDYPVTPKLVNKLLEEYRTNAEEKGDSWRTNCSLGFLVGKLAEEYNEIADEYEALDHRSGNASWDHIAEECLDLILVAAMLHERITQN